MKMNKSGHQGTPGKNMPNKPNGFGNMPMPMCKNTATPAKIAPVGGNKQGK